MDRWMYVARNSLDYPQPTHNTVDFVCSTSSPVQVFFSFSIKGPPPAGPRLSLLLRKRKPANNFDKAYSKQKIWGAKLYPRIEKD
jgi:hypothetical protein